jgi:hypothetical protein
MRTTMEMVKEFHQKFVIETGRDLHNLKLMRLTLLNEELNELEVAVRDNDKVAILDALTDLQYVLDGTYIIFGLADVKDRAFAEVHRSNMSKLGADGKAVLREDGKVLKPPGWSPPSLERFVQP